MTVVCNDRYGLALYSTSHATVWLPSRLRDNPRLGLHGELSWVFVLREEGPEQTRLILRSRTAVGPTLYRALVKALLPPADLLVAPMMLRNIRQRVQLASAFREQDKPSARAESLPHVSVPASRVAH